MVPQTPTPDTPPQREKWLGIRHEHGEVKAMFAMPSGRIREFTLSRAQALDVIADTARALRSIERTNGAD